MRATAMVAPTVEQTEAVPPAPAEGNAPESDTQYNDGDESDTREVTIYLAVDALDPEPSGSTTQGEFDVEGQVDDADIISNPRVVLTFSENTGSSARPRTVTGSITVRTNQDSDAENEEVNVILNMTGDRGTGIVTPTAGEGDVPDQETATVTPPMVALGTLELTDFKIDDDETQTYVLSLNTTTTPRASRLRRGIPSRSASRPSLRTFRIARA